MSEDQDEILWGAERIGKAANVVDENGEIDLHKTFYMLGKGYLPGRKIGRLWVSTAGAIRRAVTPREIETL